jgi:hypothetical protein
MRAINVPSAKKAISCFWAAVLVAGTIAWTAYHQPTATKQLTATIYPTTLMDPAGGWL